jgi:hypothetical protein
VNIYENICCHNPQNNKEILTWRRSLQDPPKLW